MSGSAKLTVKQAEAAEELFDRQEQQFAMGLAWMLENNKGAKAAVKANDLPDITYGGLNARAANGNRERYWDRKVLLHAAEKELVIWLKAKNLTLDPLDREDVDRQIVKILEAQQLTNRKSRGRACLPLSPAALAVIKRGGPERHWYTEFQNRWQHRLSAKKVSSVDSKRANKATMKNCKLIIGDAESAKEKGSHSLWRELAYLPDANGVPTVGKLNPHYSDGRLIKGIIDPETGNWLPGGRSRVLQIDEAGQMMNYDGKTSRKKFTRKGDACKAPEKTNRNSFSLMPCSDANARKFSDQLNFKGAGLHGGLIPRRCGAA